MVHRRWVSVVAAAVCCSMAQVVAGPVVPASASTTGSAPVHAAASTGDAATTSSDPDRAARTTASTEPSTPPPSDPEPSPSPAPPDPSPAPPDPSPSPSPSPTSSPSPTPSPTPSTSRSASPSPSTSASPSASATRSDGTRSRSNDRDRDRSRSRSGPALPSECTDEYQPIERDTDLDCDGVLEINEQVEPEEARLSLDASDPGAVLVVEDVRERFGGRVVAFDRVTAAGATVRSVDGRLVYEPADDFVGVDRFRVRVDRGRYQLEVVVTVSVSRPGDAAARAARRDGGGNDIIDGSVIDRSSGDVAGTAGVGDAAAGELALTEDRMPSRPATLFALLLLIVLCFGMATTARD